MIRYVNTGHAICCPVNWHFDEQKRGNVVVYIQWFRQANELFNAPAAHTSHQSDIIETTSVPHLIEKNSNFKMMTVYVPLTNHRGEGPLATVWGGRNAKLHAMRNKSWGSQQHSRAGASVWAPRRKRKATMFFPKPANIFSPTETCVGEMFKSLKV